MSKYEHLIGKHIVNISKTSLMFSDCTIIFGDNCDFEKYPKPPLEIPVIGINDSNGFVTIQFLDKYCLALVV